MKPLHFLIAAIFFLYSCSDDSMEPEVSLTPSDIVVDKLDIKGAHSNNPYGDGDGVVRIWVRAKGADVIRILYEGAELERRRGGEFFFRADKPGLLKYELEIQAINTKSNRSLSKFIELELERKFPIPASLYANLFVGNKKWKIDTEQREHISAYTKSGDYVYSNREIESKYAALYDDIYVLTETGISHQTMGYVVGKEELLNEDFGPIEDQANPDGEYEKYPLDSYSANWAYAGSWAFIMEGNGFIGSYVGGNHIYEIQSHSSTGFRVRTLGSDGNYWYFSLTSE